MVLREGSILDHTIYKRYRFFLI